MNVIQLRVSGRWAQFRKPETNNNPLTHDFITKTAFIGLMGAVLGWERGPQMRALFPILSEDLRYGVRVNNVVKKESWGFTLRSASSYEKIYSNRKLQDLKESRAPKQMEFLRDPDFNVTLALVNERSREQFEAFAEALQNGEARWNPVLGLHNCPADLEWIGAFDSQIQDGSYQTYGFVRHEHKPVWDGDISGIRVGFEKIPAFQNDDWWNLPERYVSVAYPSNGATLTANGEHFQISNGENYCLI
jgi:CRISPR-associated protein Cas5h